MNIYSKAILMWLLFVPVPVINGFLREKWYKHITGELLAHQLGTVIISVFFILFAYFFFRGNINSISFRQAWTIGIMWLLLTLAFEFGLGMLGGRTWSYMLSDYNMLAGRLWPLALLAIFFSLIAVKKALS